MAQLQPDYTAPELLPYRSLLGRFFAPSAPTVEAGAPQGATQTDLNTQSLAGTGQLPAAGGTLNVSGTSDTPVIPKIANPYADPDYRAMQDQMYQKIQDSIAAQKLSEQDAAKLLKDFLGQEQEMDLSPLLAWVDSSYGTNLSKGYQKPMTREERLVKSADLQDMLRKAGSGVTDKELELLRAKMGDKKAEAEILANMQYRRELLAQKKSKEGKTAFDQLNAKQQMDAKKNWYKEVGTPMNDLAQVAGNALAAKGVIESMGRRPLPGEPLYDKYQAAVAGLLTSYNKDYAKLGALAGADLTLLERATGVQTNAMTSDIAKNLFFDQDGSKTAQVLDSIAKAVDQVVTDSKGTTKVIYGDGMMDAYDELYKQYEAKKSGLSGTKPGASSANTSDIVIDNSGQKWKYKGSGDRKSKSSYEMVK